MIRAYKGKENKICSTTLIIESVNNELPHGQRVLESDWKGSSISSLGLTLLVSDTLGPFDARSVAPETCIFLGPTTKDVCISDRWGLG